VTLRDWLHSYTHNGDAQFVCAWRKRAWRAMRPVVERFVADRDAGLPVTAGGLLAELDRAAYDARISPGGKRWIEERRKLLEIVRNQRELWILPTADEHATCLVAFDLVEEHRYSEAVALIGEQAPNALGRPCPACGRSPGEHCLDPAGLSETMRHGGVPDGLWPQAQALADAGIENVHRHALIVPHFARVEP